MGIRELDFAVPDYKPVGFSSPGWNSRTDLPPILASLGFSYYADEHFDYPNQEVKVKNGLISIPTNMLAEPGGVSLLEHWVARGLSKSQMLAEFETLLSERGQLAVFYEHPGFAGREGLPLLADVLDLSLKRGYKFVCFRDLAGFNQNENSSTLS